MVDAQDFAPAILDADDAKLHVGGLGLELGDQTLCHPIMPGLFGKAIDRIDSAGTVRADQSVQRGRGSEARDIAARAADVGLQVGGEKRCMRLYPIQHARQDRTFEVAIAQPPDRKYRDRHQHDHGDREPSGERQSARGTVRPRIRAFRQG
jgi:hypothetical protein